MGKAVSITVKSGEAAEGNESVTVAVSFTVEGMTDAIEVDGTWVERWGFATEGLADPVEQPEFSDDGVTHAYEEAPHSCEGTAK